MSARPYRFIMSLSDQELQHRRYVLDLKGQYAQISALVLLGVLYLSRFRSNSKTIRKTWWDAPAIKGSSETRKQYAVTLSWLAWLISIAVWRSGDDYIHLTKALGHVGLSQLPFLVLLAPTSFLFSSKLALSAIVSSLTLIPQTTLTAYHRLLGRLVIVPLICSHATLFLLFYVQVPHPEFGTLFAKRVRDPDVQFGLAATLFAILVLVFSRSRIWKLRTTRVSSRSSGRSQLFYIVHLALVSVFFVLAYSHVVYARPFVLEAIGVSLANLMCCRLLA
ncbi:hypothetical protein BGW36DRAFT_385245 [Talaromyces proteolyticus]|uniref:Ferric oxidoreductase domain-containing protein n=1 Tax=Talaromyces proteolyticus TaxID=1131652 RepID=A0AAD4KMX1_9EURO|nr:uncharacterized protein BGW36DRAFT_385245 [Talaromyces proteolyticus]KAH8692845.1 hypothetical protein BGW36DRAFT_385245 [Talaromyces proteolyticus]